MSTETPNLISDKQLAQILKGEHEGKVITDIILEEVKLSVADYDAPEYKWAICIAISEEDGLVNYYIKDFYGRRKTYAALSAAAKTVKPLKWHRPVLVVWSDSPKPKTSTLTPRAEAVKTKSQVFNPTATIVRSKEDEDFKNAMIKWFDKYYPSDTVFSYDGSTATVFGTEVFDLYNRSISDTIYVRLKTIADKRKAEHELA